MQKMESACTPKKVGIFHILFLLFAGFEISEFSYRIRRTNGRINENDGWY